jgi:hypothetical protein
MKSLLALTTLSLVVIASSQSHAEKPKIDGKWESAGIVITIDRGGFVYPMRPILGDPGWKSGQIMIGAEDESGNFSFEAKLISDNDFEKDVTGTIVKKGEVLTIEFSENSGLAQKKWARGTGGVKGGTTLRVFCEAGYVARFKANWKQPNEFGGYDAKSWTSSNLTAGRRDNTKIPIGSRNVTVSGYMLSAGERHIKTMNVDFNKEYKVYGTIFSPQMVAQ